MTGRPSVGVVLPVRNGGRLLAEVLAALSAQTVRPDQVVVVDDRSTDDSAAVARQAGAEVVTGGGGPYRSRNLGWRATATDVVAFVDARSRPAPTWLERTVALLADPGVAMATSQTVVVGGDSLVERASRLQQVFDVATYLDRPWFLPYFATCNLVVRRSALAAVGGFAEVRSGGDADLCWRIQLAGLGSLTAVRDPLMRWQARVGLRDALEQTYRYGRSRVELSRRFADRGCPPHVSAPARAMVPYLARASIAIAVRTALHRQPEAAARNLLSIYRATTWLGSRRETRHRPKAAAATAQGTKRSFDV